MDFSNSLLPQSLGGKEQAGDVNGKPMEKLISVLKGIEQDASPSVYVVSEVESYGPNAHFSVSLHGDSAPEGDTSSMRQFESKPQSRASQLVVSGQSITPPSKVSKHPQTTGSSTTQQGNAAKYVSRSFRSALE